MQQLGQLRRVVRVTSTAVLAGGRGRSGVTSAGAESFDEFVRREQAGLVRYAALLAGSRQQGEDLVQDVLVRVLPRWDRLSTAPGGRLAYVRRAVTNEHVSWRRRWSTRHIRYQDSVPDVPAVTEPQPDDVLWRRLQRLPAQQRAALVLRYYEGLPDAEIGELLGCRPTTVRAHVSRGLAQLRVAIETSERGGVPR